MNFTNRFPYTTLNNINLDWIIKRVKELGTTVRSYAQDIASAAALAETAQEAAESALNNAQTAQTAAADALETAESASATAEGVADTANAAQAAAQAAQTTAQAAQTTAQAAQTAVAGKQDAPATPGTAGQVLGLDGNLSPVWVNQSGGGGGTSDYNALENKPTINNVTLTGNKTGADLGLASATDLSAVSTTAQAAQTAAQAAQTAAQAAQTTADDAADDAADAMTAAQTAQTTANNKENAIDSSVTGVLYRTASGVIRAAVAGTDYLTPATNYSPWSTHDGVTSYSIVADDAGKTIRTNYKCTITLTRAVSQAMPIGTEIGLFCGATGADALILLNLPDGRTYGRATGFTSIKLKGICSMNAIKKAWGNTWFVTGPDVEVVS